MRRIAGTILTPDGWRQGELAVTTTIDDIVGVPVATPTPPHVVPGFVDLHVHGGGGADVMQGTAAIRTMARTHARHGTTSLLATTVTAPVADIDAAIAAIGAVMADPGQGEAAVLGAHLEGPFLNPDKLGAQPPFALPPDRALLERWVATGRVRVLTFAPECDRGGVVAAAAAGVRLQVGHSLADAATATEAFVAGAGATHLFNAMSGLDHRAPGVVGAAFAHAAWAEIIADLVHVDATAILAARRAIPGLYAVTDATAGAGMPDGSYPLGRHVAHKRQGAMRLADGTLAGSALTMDQALRNLVAIGLPLAEAVARCATVPADRLGLADRGRVAEGLRADLVLLDEALEVQAVIIGGEAVALEARP